MATTPNERLAKEYPDVVPVPAEHRSGFMVASKTTLGAFWRVWTTAVGSERVWLCTCPAGRVNAERGYGSCRHVRLVTARVAADNKQHAAKPAPVNVRALVGE